MARGRFAWWSSLTVPGLAVIALAAAMLSALVWVRNLSQTPGVAPTQPSAVGTAVPAAAARPRDGAAPRAGGLSDRSRVAPESAGATQPAAPAVPPEPPRSWSAPAPASDVPARESGAVASARRLFYGELTTGGTPGLQTASSTGSAPGLKYSVIRRLPGEDEAEAEVEPDTRFHSGDRIRLSFESNLDGYLYVVQEGSSGRWSTLFPSPLINGGRNTVERFQRYLVPPQGWFRFDAHPGSEQLLVVLSRDPLEQLPGMNEPVTRPEEIERSVVDEINRTLKPRDLGYEKDTERARERSTFVVNRDDGGRAVTVAIHLAHGE